MLCLAASSLGISACSKKQETATTTTTTTEVANASTAPAEAPATLAAAPMAADNANTLSGAKLAAYTGDAVKGASAFLECKTCHAVEEGVDKIGPSLHGVVGRKAGSIASFSYSAANKGSGITWTPEKLFQYLENPQRVVPGTKMTYVGMPDPQKRADLIAYLKTNS